MKVIASILSISLTAITILPAVASDVSVSDRALWIESTLASNHGSTSNAKANTKKINQSKSITSAGSNTLAHSVADLYSGVKMRPFVPNRYLPSERDIEEAQAQANTAQLPASTVQLANAMATTQAQIQARNVQQHQLQGNVAYTGGYSNNVSANAQTAQQVSASTRATSIQSRINTLNALMPSIPEPMSSNETIGQIRSSLRNNGGQFIASAQTTGYGSNLYPDVVSPVPTQANANTSNAAPSPLSFLSKNSTRQFNNAGNKVTGSRSANLSPSTFGSWQQTQRQTQSTQQASQSQRQASGLSFGGFQSYTGKLHIQSTTARSNAQTTQAQNTKAAAYTSSLPADCNIASADCYSTATSHISSYAGSPYVSSQSSALPY